MSDNNAELIAAAQERLDELHRACFGSPLDLDAMWKVRDSFGEVLTALESATPRIVRTEWGVRDLTGAITPYYMERSARYFAERGEGELLSREVTEWQPFTPTESGEPQ